MLLASRHTKHTTHQFLTSPLLCLRLHLRDVMPAWIPGATVLVSIALGGEGCRGRVAQVAGGQEAIWVCNGPLYIVMATHPAQAPPHWQILSSFPWNLVSLDLE